MNLDDEWDRQAVAAEISDHGTGRLLVAHNRLVGQCDALRADLAEQREIALRAARKAGAAVRERDALRAMLADAADEIEAWALYAKEYFRMKHDLAGTLKRFRDAAMKAAGGG